MQERGEVIKMRELAHTKIPDEIDYSSVPSLSNEVRAKLIAARPATLGAALNISGITPAAIDILHIAIKQLGRKK